MFTLFNNFTKNITFLLNFTPKHKFCSKFVSTMNEVQIKKPRYDGRTKKRKWEERRTDKGGAIGIISKQAKLENTNVTEVSVEKIIDKIKRRKFVLLMGYSGVNYSGMQRNPGLKTIEGELFTALKNVGLINDIDFDQVQNFSFQRAARTDKGE